jgi:hypothetical protein
MDEEIINENIPFFNFTKLIVLTILDTFISTYIFILFWNWFLSAILNLNKIDVFDSLCLNFFISFTKFILTSYEENIKKFKINKKK